MALKKGTESGFTLIEIMVGMMLTGLLVVSLSGLWYQVGDQFFRLTLRQKAVFVLHGHMERIAAMYRTGETMTAVTTTGYDAGFPDHPAGDHTVLSADGAGIVETVLGNFSEGEIYYFDQGVVGGSSDDRNVVWLDPGKKRVTAQLSWTLSNVTGDQNCYEAGTATSFCQLLTLYLDYPFRFLVGSSAPMGIMWDQPKTLTLQTIVGRR